MVSNAPGHGKFRPYALEAMAGRPPTREAPPFGKRLAALRKQRGLTQLQLADELGVSRKMVDYYERRAQNPSTSFVTKAADVLGVSVAYLLEEGPVSSSTKKAKPGPASALEERLQKVRRLPKKEQEVVLRMLDGVLAGAQQR